MFKLVKIIGARTNVPEPTYVNIDPEREYLAGCFYYFTEGKITTYPVSQDDLKFIPLETLPANSEKTKIFGYFVTENMVFETDILGDYTAVKIGNTLLAHYDENDNICAVEAEVGYDIKLLSMDEADTRKKVFVALKW